MFSNIPLRARIAVIPFAVIAVLCGALVATSAIPPVRSEGPAARGAFAFHERFSPESTSLPLTVLRSELDRAGRFRSRCLEGSQRACAWLLAEIDRLHHRFDALPPFERQTFAALMIKVGLRELADWRRDRIETTEGRDRAHLMRLWALGSAQRGDYKAAAAHMAAAEAIEAAAIAAATAPAEVPANATFGLADTMR